jgi:hypothetical protein
MLSDVPRLESDFLRHSAPLLMSRRLRDGDSKLVIGTRSGIQPRGVFSVVLGESTAAQPTPRRPGVKVTYAPSRIVAVAVFHKE